MNIYTNDIKMFRTKQTVSTRGKEAITEYRLVKRLEGYSLLEVSLQTGRTHQIRVHLSYIGYPIIGDSTYGGRKKFAKGSSENIIALLLLPPLIKLFCLNLIISSTVQNVLQFDISLIYTL